MTEAPPYPGTPITKPSIPEQPYLRRNYHLLLIPIWFLLGYTSVTSLWNGNILLALTTWLALWIVDYFMLRRSKRLGITFFVFTGIYTALGILFIVFIFAIVMSCGADC